MDKLIIIVLTLLFSAFFSGMEIAFVSANKLRIELQSKQGYLPARIMSRFIEIPSRFIATMLVGNNTALVIYGIVMARVLEPVIRIVTSSDIAIFIIQTVLATSFVLVAAEFIPKALFRINPNRTLNFFAIPVWIIYYLLYPVVYLMLRVSEVLLKKILNVSLYETKPVFGRIDLDDYIRESTPVKEEGKEIDTEIEIFRNALDFSNVKVRECMVPRTEVVALDVHETMDVLRQNFIDTGFSKILIYRGDKENIIGYTHSYEQFKCPEKIEAILLPISPVPETMSANELLKMLIKQQRSIAVVVDEFGGTAGIVTIEDIMEEIFGEIVDEHDIGDLLEKELNEKEYKFSGRLEIDYLNEKYNISLPESQEYETLSGMIVHYHESIPESNEKINIENFEFTITGVSETRIEEVNLTIK